MKLKPYPLFYDYGWWIDFAELERRIGPRTRAIVVVHPNNPTGHATGAAERIRLEEICVRHGLALIVDEVFLDYPVGSEKLSSFALGQHPALTFVLSGLSKIAGLPQMKVGWLVALGPESDRAEALGATGGNSRYVSLDECSSAMGAAALARGPARDSGADSFAGEGESDCSRGCWGEGAADRWRVERSFTSAAAYGR